MLKFLRDRKDHIFFILFFLVMYIISAAFLPRISTGITKATGYVLCADVLLCSSICTGLLKGRKFAAYYAVASGFILDITFGNPYAFSPLVFFLCAYFAQTASTPFSRKTPLSVLLISAMLLWIKGLSTFFYLLVIWKDASVGMILLHGVLPEYLLGIIVCALIFAVMRILMAVFRIPVKEAQSK